MYNQKRRAKEFYITARSKISYRPTCKAQSKFSVVAQRRQIRQATTLHESAQAFRQRRSAEQFAKDVYLAQKLIIWNRFDESLGPRTEVDSYDDSAEDPVTHTICESKISYLRSTAGNAESIAIESRCTQNNQPLPEVKRQTFRWNAEVHRFDELQGIPQNKYVPGAEHVRMRRGLRRAPSPTLLRIDAE
jgi:hypothetical protein